MNYAEYNQNKTRVDLERQNSIEVTKMEIAKLMSLQWQIWKSLFEEVILAPSPSVFEHCLILFFHFVCVDLKKGG